MWGSKRQMVNSMSCRRVVNKPPPISMVFSSMNFYYFLLYYIIDLFVGQLKSTLICQTCGYKSVTFDPFWDLSLPIPKVRGVTHCQTVRYLNLILCIEVKADVLPLHCLSDAVCELMTSISLVYIVV